MIPSILMAPLPYSHTCTRDFWNGTETDTSSRPLCTVTICTRSTTHVLKVAENEVLSRDARLREIVVEYSNTRTMEDNAVGNN